MGVCNCSMYCCTLLYVHSSIAIILMGKRELIALLNLSSWCLMMVERFFLTVPRGCLQFVIVVFPDHTHLLYLKSMAPGVPSAESRFIARNSFLLQNKSAEQLGQSFVFVKIPPQEPCVVLMISRVN